MLSFQRPFSFAAYRRQPFEGSFFLGGSNVQINSRDDIEAEQEDQSKSNNPESRRFPLSVSRKGSEKIEFENNDEASQPNESAEDSQELREPQYPGKRRNVQVLHDAVEALSPKRQINIVFSPLGVQNDETSDTTSQQEAQSDSSVAQDDEENFVERLNIPTQDVDEQDESMRAENSNNIAYSYSSYVPSYQIAPNSYHHAQQLNYLSKTNLNVNLYENAIIIHS